MKVVGAIDIGSNAIRMICARLTEDRRVEIIDKVRTPVRLGGDVFSQGAISVETQQQLLNALQIYKRTFAQNKCEELRVYATSAFREAQNQEEILQLLERETGMQVEAISGGKEAQLLQRALQTVVNLRQGSFMMADLGGGSVEITVTQAGEIQFAESFRIGTVRLLEMFPYHADTEKEFIKWIKPFLADFFHFLTPRLEGFQFDQFMITGGNAAAIAALRERFAGAGSTLRDNVTYLDKEDFKKIKKEITNRSLAQRITELGMPPDRADVIVPAVYVFDRLLGFSKCKTLVIPEVGLREGILAEIVEEHFPVHLQDEYQQILHSAYYYAKKYQANLEHSETVQRLSMQLFDGTLPLHHFTERERIYLEVAAILHDIGRFIRPSNHHKHSMYLIQNMELVGLTNVELHLISVIARFHTQGPLSTTNRDYGKLSKKHQKLVNGLTAMLRVADAFDREHQSIIKNMLVQCDDKRVLLSVDHSHDLLLAEWALNQKKLLFEKTFERKLEITH